MSCKVNSLILFVYNNDDWMILKEQRKCFRIKEKQTRIKIQPQISANRPFNKTTGPSSIRYQPHVGGKPHYMIHYQSNVQYLVQKKFQFFATKLKTNKQMSNKKYSSSQWAVNILICSTMYMGVLQGTKDMQYITVFFLCIL